EVILNGDSPAPTRVIEGVVQPVAPTTVEQRLARKNELKARGTLLMALPYKHQLKFNITLMEAIEKRFGGNKETKKKLISQLKILRESLPQEDINLKFLRSLPTEWRTHTLIWRNKTDLEEQSLDDLFNSLKIYEAEVKSSSSASTSRQNIAFVSSQNTDNTNEPVSAVASVSVSSAKIHVSALPNVDTLSNPVIYSFLLMAILTVRARRFLQRTGMNLGANGPTSMGFDMSKVECYNCHRKGHFARECSVMVWAAMTGAFRQKKNQPTMPSWHSLPQVLLVLTMSSKTDESLPASPIYDRYQSGEGNHAVPPPYTGTFMPPKPDLVFHDAPNVNETVHTIFNVKFSPTKPDQDLSHTHRPSAPIIEDWVSDSKDDSEAELSQNVPAANPKTGILKPQANGNSRNRNACFVCKSLTYLIKDCDYYETQMVQTTPRHHAKRGNTQHYAKMSLPNPQRHVVPTVVLTKSKLVPLTAAGLVTTAVPQPYVTTPRPAKTVVTKSHSPPRRNINRRLSLKPSNFPPKLLPLRFHRLMLLKHALKDKGVIDNGCSRHMTGNMSYLSDFEEINGGYVAFGGNLKGGKIYGKGRPMRDFWLGTLSGPTWLFDIDTLTKTMNYQPVTAGNQSNPSAGVQEQFDAEKAAEENVQQYVLFSLWSSGSRNPQNTDDDAFEVKEPEFEGKKHESEVHVSLTSCAKTKKHNDKTTKESKGKSHVELSTGYSNLSEKFKDFFDNSINEVNAASTSVPAVGQISTNNANTFSVVGPSNTVVSPTLENSSYVDTSQYPGDSNMPKLEDITYSDDEEDVGAEADFTNLETTITVSPIPITRVHKDHHVTQIIGDLSSATQIKSMKRVAKDQGRLSQINNEDFHTCMFACFLLQEEPEREEGIDYKEVFAPVARIEAIRLFLAYASFMGFMMYQMDAKSTFLYGTIDEEVYVCQPLGFEDPDYPNKVYKVVNALYGLHQAPRVWYKTLANYLLENGFQRGKIDQTLFIKRQKGYILLVQFYVDDIIFGSTNKDLCKAFEKLMKDKFQMSLMGKLTFFFGLQV
nr:putative ribonuclease H-like domain-containing protein [Tanacetum cinerariifolium]